MDDNGPKDHEASYLGNWHGEIFTMDKNGEDVAEGAIDILILNLN